jgi:hypothetical protein
VNEDEEMAKWYEEVDELFEREWGVVGAVRKAGHDPRLLESMAMDKWSEEVEKHYERSWALPGALRRAGHDPADLLELMARVPLVHIKCAHCGTRAGTVEGQGSYGRLRVLVGDVRHSSLDVLVCAVHGPLDVTLESVAPAIAKRVRHATRGQCALAGEAHRRLVAAARASVRTGHARIGAPHISAGERLRNSVYPRRPGAHPTTARLTRTPRRAFVARSGQDHHRSGA